MIAKPAREKEAYLAYLALLFGTWEPTASVHSRDKSVTKAGQAKSIPSFEVRYTHPPPQPSCSYSITDSERLPCFSACLPARSSRP
jgi:hypothetical protein